MSSSGHDLFAAKKGDVPSVVEIQRRLAVILRDVRHSLHKTESLIACA